MTGKPMIHLSSAHMLESSDSYWLMPCCFTGGLPCYPSHYPVSSPSISLPLPKLCIGEVAREVVMYTFVGGTGNRGRKLS